MKERPKVIDLYLFTSLFRRAMKQPSDPKVREAHCNRFSIPKEPEVVINSDSVIVPTKKQVTLISTSLRELLLMRSNDRLENWALSIMRKSGQFTQITRLVSECDSSSGHLRVIKNPVLAFVKD